MSPASEIRFWPRCYRPVRSSPVRGFWDSVPALSSLPRAIRDLDKTNGNLDRQEFSDTWATARWSFPQHWFSVGGPGPQTTSQMSIQYFFQYFPGDGWGIGTSPNMLVNWYANKSGDELTFPIGPQISKVIKIGPLR